ncbi:YafY family transcriptional regulator [Nitratireductor mangrovi]|uniref:YafY family transcriptional regulator n=1 Tax=Nitratireductor mangrovi TaxID=2599600 RepID=A0A5B8L195_9HYPH|nr:YafY family protein [Nitratireductor mangrovi]QDZ01705.1 YafY family transcriptional regulator [Nitratireductor mangrovi]
MSRAERLLELIEVLRRHRRPASGSTLARETGVSLRTLYRDIASLRAQGAPIEGEPGLGYVLQPGFMLPPLMLRDEEIEALLLGSQWVAERGDERLGTAARNAMAKVASVLPDDLRNRLDTSTLMIGPVDAAETDTVDLAVIREAIRKEHRLEIVYRKEGGKGETRRTIWPFALGFFERVRVVVAWCELRQAIRHFRGDRILAMSLTGERYPRRRHALMREWQQAEQEKPLR